MKQYKRPKKKAVLPADIRFGNRISDDEKLAYGEILAAGGKKDFCWSQNGYLANLLSNCTITITRALKKLAALKLIELNYNPEMGDRREIHLLPLPGAFSSGSQEVQI